MVTKKKVSLPNYVLKILERDIEIFDISKDDFMNQLIANTKCRYEQLTIKKMGKNILFNMNSMNECFIKELSREYLDESESSIIRRIIMTYIELPQYKRELLIFKQSVDCINQAIAVEKKITIEIRSKAVIVSPFFIMNNDECDSNYLFCYCEEFQLYKVYNICRINKKSIRILDFPNDVKDPSYIAAVKENFDPYLSYGKTIKVRLKEDGVHKLIDSPYNRPKVLDVNGEIWTFECSDYKAIIYFSAFENEVEVLEPQSLREEFIERFKYALKMYNGT